MARTKSFKELVQHHVKRDAKFAEALLREGVDAMLSGDVETGKTILRDYIKATVGFEKLGAATGAPPKEPDPHVRSARQPAGQEPFQRNRLSAKASGRASSCFQIAHPPDTASLDPRFLHRRVRLGARILPIDEPIAEALLDPFYGV